jgi:sugar phosphate isomerase/epimerase
MIWGYSGIWPGEFGIRNGDQQINMMKFASEHGFRATGVRMGVIQEPERLAKVTALAEELDLRLVPHFRCRYFQDDTDTIRRQVDEFLGTLSRYGKVLRVPIVTTAVGPYHRFMDSPSLPEQMDRLAEVLGPLAAGCHELGSPFGIENHGDYYCADLVDLCERVPHLGIFLDTGNTYLIGEQSLPACRGAAPYTIGTHFKDHYVHPDPEELKFVVQGAPLGSGHVGLREVYGYLKELAPDPGKLVMMWEMVPPKGMDAFECLEQSWQFIRSLE